MFSDQNSDDYCPGHSSLGGGDGNLGDSKDEGDTNPPTLENFNDNSCDGSGLVTTFCLHLDATYALKLENFLDKLSFLFNTTSYFEYFGSAFSVIEKLFPSNIKIAIFAVLTTVEAPVALALFIAGSTSSGISKELSSLSKSISDSNITRTGGTLVISSNIVYNNYEVITPSGKVNKTNGFMLLAGTQATQSIVEAWYVTQLAINSLNGH